MISLLKRIRRIGILLFIGLLVIVYAGFGLLYYQQGSKQEELTQQVVNLQLITGKEIPSNAKLLSQYSAFNKALSPITIPVVITAPAANTATNVPPENAYLNILNRIYEAAITCNINTNPENQEFIIPLPDRPITTKIGTISYQVIAIKGIVVRGDPSDVNQFIKMLDAGEILNTMVLRQIKINTIGMSESDPESIRISEYYDVLNALHTMLRENNIEQLPHPDFTFVAGLATNNMAEFPDNTSSWVEAINGKTIDISGISFGVNDLPGYVLFNHDASADSDSTNLVDYLKWPVTKYYYTCDADGTLRQFDGSDTISSQEFTYFGLNKTQAVIDVDIYSLPPAVEK